MKLVHYKNHKFSILVVLISCLLISENVFTDNRFINTETMVSQEKKLESLANEWNVSVEEYHRYQSLMSGARGVWTPEADPLIVLGSHARSESERKRFAELYVRKEFERIEGELKFQNEVDSAWKRLFPNKSIFDDKQNTPELSGLLSGYIASRYAIFLKRNCEECLIVLKNHLDEVQRNKNLKALDIYVLETEGDDNKLREYISQNNIPVELIRKKRITVNHGNEYRGKKVPAVFVLQEGSDKWQLVD